MTSKTLATALALAVLSGTAMAEGAFFRLTRPAGGQQSGPTQDPGPTPQALFARPFSTKSVWNAPITPDSTFEDVPGIAGIPVGLSSWLVPDMISVPVFQASSSDGTSRLLFNPHTWQNLYDGTWKASGNPPDVEATIRAGATPTFPYQYHTYVSQSATGFQLPPGSYNPQLNPADGSAFTFKAPLGIHPNRNSDAWMAVFQPDGKAVETYATIVLSDNTVVAMTYQVTDAALGGDGWQNGVTASMIPVYAGLIRRSDLQSGSIAHALKLLAPASLLATSYTYPALSFDRGAITQNPPYSGTLPMGARIALPPGVDAASLGIKTALGKMVADAASTYGMVVTDQGGSGVTIVTEEGIPAEYGWDWDVQSDMSKVVSACLRVHVPATSYRPSR